MNEQHAMEDVSSDDTSVKVRVSFMGDLVALTGQRTLEATLPRGSTVEELLVSLSRTFGDGYMTRVFSAPGRLRHTILVFVDGKNVRQRGGLSLKLGDSEVEVVMLPMFGGG
jgi:molybdopterin converting factor small subunit